MWKNLCQDVWYAKKIKERLSRPGEPSAISHTNPTLGRTVNGFYYRYTKSEGKSIIMVVVYWITKYAQFFSLSQDFKVSIVPEEFMETSEKLHGIPNIIVSDIDLIFNGIF